MSQLSGLPHQGEQYCFSAIETAAIDQMKNLDHRHSPATLRFFQPG